jgi:F-type H+-transporting ATPase subunit epsilon
MATPFHVALITPERSLFDDEAEEVTMRTEIGEIAFLAHHEDLIGASAVTAVRITTSAGEGETATVRAAVDGGTVHVSPDGLVIAAPVAELAEEIDVERARGALERAEQRLASLGERRAEGGAEDAERVEAEIAAAQSAASRARARLDAAGADTAA